MLPLSSQREQQLSTREDELDTREKELQRWREQLREQDQRVQNREDQLTARDADLTTRELQLRNNEREFAEQKTKISAWVESVDRRDAELTGLSRHLERREQEIKAREDRARQFEQDHTAKIREEVLARVAHEMRNLKSQLESQKVVLEEHAAEKQTWKNMKQQHLERLAQYERDEAELKEKLAAAESALNNARAAAEDRERQMKETSDKLDAWRTTYELQMSQLKEKLEKNQAGEATLTRKLESIYTRVNAALEAFELSRLPEVGEGTTSGYVDALSHVSEIFEGLPGQVQSAMEQSGRELLVQGVQDLLNSIISHDPSFEADYYVGAGPLGDADPEREAKAAKLAEKFAEQYVKL